VADGPDAVDGPSEEEMEALDALGRGGEWDFAGRTLKLTNLDKAIFPGRDGGPPLTKRDLVRYHSRIAPHLLPYLRGRALNTNRFPDGVDRAGFWQKAVPGHAPPWVARWDYPDARPDDTRTYVVVDEPATLAWLANQAAVELHPWNPLTATWREPAWAFIDIDPGTRTSFDDVLVMTRLHKVVLDELDVRAAAKVTGKRGVQIWIPVAPGLTFEETRGWVEVVSKAVGKVMPEMVSWAWSTSDRRGRARLDYTQNVHNKTLVAPFSARPAPGAPVSMPIRWDELDDPDLTPDRWTILDAVERVASVGDPLLPLIGLAQDLPRF